MPRIPTSLLRKAHTIDRFLPPLLGSCRELHAAQNELRWLREHVEYVAKTRRIQHDTLAKSALLRRLVRQRALGKPLQYILGMEYFGDLEIRCRPGVLIPRQDTAASVSHLTHLMLNARNLPAELRVMDLCTGSGCIPLLFQHEFRSTCNDFKLRTLGVDISNRALQLATHNLRRMCKDRLFDTKDDTQFLRADILAKPSSKQQEGPPPLTTALELHRKPALWDILISNPPYISPSGYWKTTTRSVRGYEPKLALVPPLGSSSTDTGRGDVFYRPLLEIVRYVDAKIVLLEVADMDQAGRVARMAHSTDLFDGIEIWREQPDHPSSQVPKLKGDKNDFPVIGQGNGRSVFCWRGAGAQWLGRTPGPASGQRKN